MSNIEIIVPDLPESVMDATVVAWHKKVGDWIERNEVLVDLETDKVVLEVPAIHSGIIEKIIEPVGSIVISKQILGIINSSNKDNNISVANKIVNDSNIVHDSKKDVNLTDIKNIHNPVELPDESISLSPALRRLIAKHDYNDLNCDDNKINNRLISYDFKKYLYKLISQKYGKNISNIEKKHSIVLNENNHLSHRSTNCIPMTRLRQRIADRLLYSKNNTAMLTTFNEVNMYPIIALRNKYGEYFEKKYSVKLGFMSFFIKAVVEALKYYPELNGMIDGDNIIYHNYYDINIAVATNRGLVTPILKNVDILSIAEIEKNIKELAYKARNDQLTIEELNSGTFTITNGGVFGSFMSTPIINPPQSAILGMHAIKDRAMVIDGKIEIVPMMYLALSYDHCLIDGRESVSFLVKIKNIIEDPNRLLLNI
uniref:Dihydrolipoyllysine-residue succinyltransferase n=1 Tax=Candidatus Aschnera chinzeii TaxID=1485666 RepID=A0AAT9G3X4_9ENTR|nr:MAG: 2-oxoglutarate dehydrogenase complex dihydrolipoyllysine-residue succinyltransferase [Candidatus Aschnera chinzeii]